MGYKYYMKSVLRSLIRIVNIEIEDNSWVGQPNLLMEVTDKDKCDSS